MERDSGAPDGRPVMVQTTRGTVEGRAVVHPGIRTLDWLNHSQRFLEIEITSSSVTDWSFDQGLVGINRDMVLFVAELTDKLPTTDARVEAAHYSREAVALRVGEFDVKGYLHVRGILDPLIRLSRRDGEFTALTSASVLGPEVELASSFLAVNPDHVLGAQPILQEAPEPALDSLVGSHRR